MKRTTSTLQSKGLNKMRYPVLLLSTFLLTGCFEALQDYTQPKAPVEWSAYQNQLVQETEVMELKNWWERFDDQALNDLVAMTLADSPDRQIAEARVLEARGLRRNIRSSLFPQIGASGQVSREDTGFAGPDNYFEYGFDASYEIDVFGRNRKATDAASKQVEALEYRYHDTTLTLIADVARSYIIYREAQKQVDIAVKNLEIQEKTLELIREQQKFGEAPQLDVERAENLVNTTRASIPEFERLAENARLQLSVLTGSLPEDLVAVLDTPADIPGQAVEPVLMAPAQVLLLRPDVRASAANFASTTDLAEAAIADIFPQFTLSGFFGYSKGAFSGTANVWNIVLGTAVSVLDFGRLEGQVDAARAVEMNAYHSYRKTVLEAVVEVETALNDIARINERRASLLQAFNNAEKAYTLSEKLYKEGEISFLDLLDAQRTVNEADAALVAAEAAQATSLVSLYKSLGVY